jgi:hypothetical protein
MVTCERDKRNDASVARERMIERASALMSRKGELIIEETAWRLRSKQVVRSSELSPERNPSRGGRESSQTS